jgi:hypothetical protein
MQPGQVRVGVQGHVCLNSPLQTRRNVLPPTLNNLLSDLCDLLCQTEGSELFGCLALVPSPGRDEVGDADTAACASKDTHREHQVVCWNGVWLEAGPRGDLGPNERVAESFAGEEEIPPLDWVTCRVVLG